MSAAAIWCTRCSRNGLSPAACVAGSPGSARAGKTAATATNIASHGANTPPAVPTQRERRLGVRHMASHP